MMTPREKSERLYGAVGVVLTIVALAIAIAAFHTAGDGEIGFRRVCIRLVVASMIGTIAE